MYEAECVVVGAGVVGLAVARELALSGREVIVLEAEGDKGQHASSRNTGVIHAGIGYAPGSLKSRLCLDGKKRLYRFCAEHSVPHAMIGKLVIAEASHGEAGLTHLKTLQETSRRQGLEELHLLSAEEARSLEPQLACAGALWSPTSGIVDVHAYMDALQGDIEDHGGFIAYSSPVRSANLQADRIWIEVDDREQTRLSCRVMINAAGLNAPLVAARTENRDAASIPPRLLSRGVYAVLRRPSPFRRLIYPAPHGVHISLDLAGQMRVGPDSEWIDDVDYTVDERRIEPFYEKIRAFWPDIREGDLMPGWAGIRAKISRAGTKDVDFRIEATSPGRACLIDLFGIDSPGLTSSLAIAAEVGAAVERREARA